MQRTIILKIFILMFCLCGGDLKAQSTLAGTSGPSFRKPGTVASESGHFQKGVKRATPGLKRNDAFKTRNKQKTKGETRAHGFSAPTQTRGAGGERTFFKSADQSPQNNPGSDHFKSPVKIKSTESGTDFFSSGRRKNSTVETHGAFSTKASKSNTSGLPDAFSVRQKAKSDNADADHFGARVRMKNRNETDAFAQKVSPKIFRDTDPFSAPVRNSDRNSIENTGFSNRTRSIKRTENDAFSSKVFKPGIHESDAFSSAFKSGRTYATENRWYSKWLPGNAFGESDAFSSADHGRNRSEEGDHFTISGQRTAQPMWHIVFHVPFLAHLDPGRERDAFASPFSISARKDEPDAFTGGGSRTRRRFVNETGKLSLKNLFKSKPKDTTTNDSFTLTPRQRKKMERDKANKQNELDLFPRSVTRR